jgi:hypothetical protein
MVLSLSKDFRRNDVDVVSATFHETVENDLLSQDLSRTKVFEFSPFQ